jgi:hypothetical protein
MAGPTEKMHLDRRVPIFPNGSSIINPYDDIFTAQFFNPIGTGGIICRVSDGTARIFAKITEFPVATDCQWAAESMYVLLNVIIPESTTGEQLQKLMEEHMYEGIGILVNHPQYCTVVKYGDRIRFKNGSYGIKAVFDSKI